MNDYSLIQLQAAAQRTANVYARVANREMGARIPVPVNLTFDLQDFDPKCSGRAHATMHVEINMILFEDNVDYILNNTIPHEIGHLVQFDKFDLKGASTPGHGAEWQEIMRRLGKTPSKHHNLDISRAVAHFKAKKKAKKKALKDIL